MDKNNITFSLRTGDPNSAGNDLSLGKGDKSFSSGQAASKIIKHVADAFKAAYAAKAVSLDKVSKELNQKTFGQISKDLVSNLKTGKNKIDTTIEQGVFGATAAQDAIIMAGMVNKRQEATSGDEYNAGTNPMIYSMKEGKYVEAPFTEKLVDVTDEYGTVSQVKQKVYDTTALMYDKNGVLISDKNSSGGVDLADIVTPTLTTTSGAITGGTTAGATTGTSAGGQGTVNVVTTADNSQRNSQSINTYYTNLLSASRNPISDASVNAGMPG
jgi:hypothetical protein